jgi:leucyl aminopeptidase (aminopeptidase T)
MALVFAVLIAIPQPRVTIAGTSSEDVAKKTEEALEAFKNYLIEKKKEALEHGKALLKKTDEEIEVLEAKAAKASGEAKTAYDEEIKSLKQKRDKAGKKFDELENASKDSWEAAKQGFAEAYEALYEAYKEALTKFK